MKREKAKLGFIGAGVRTEEEVEVETRETVPCKECGFPTLPEDLTDGICPVCQGYE